MAKGKKTYTNIFSAKKWQTEVLNAKEKERNKTIINALLLCQRAQDPDEAIDFCVFAAELTFKKGIVLQLLIEHAARSKNKKKRFLAYRTILYHSNNHNTKETAAIFGLDNYDWRNDNGFLQLILSHCNETGIARKRVNRIYTLKKELSISAPNSAINLAREAYKSNDYAILETACKKLMPLIKHNPDIIDEMLNYADSLITLEKHHITGLAILFKIGRCPIPCEKDKAIQRIEEYEATAACPPQTKKKIEQYFMNHKAKTLTRPTNHEKLKKNKLHEHGRK